MNADRLWAEVPDIVRRHVRPPPENQSRLRARLRRNAGLSPFFTPREYLGLQPCPLCMFQRVCIAVLGIVFLIAGLHRVRYHGAIVYAGFIFFAAAAATWVAGRHVWIQHQPPGTVPACGAPLDNLLQMFPLLEVDPQSDDRRRGVRQHRLDDAGNLDAGLGVDRGGLPGARRHRQQRRLPGARAPLEDQAAEPPGDCRECQRTLGW